MRPETKLRKFYERIPRGAPNECWEWTGSHNWKGYGAIYWDSKRTNAHRVAYMLATGEKLEPGEQVLHRCDNPPCCNPAHLFKGNNYTNIQDKMRKGRHRAPRGEECWKCKLNASQVLEIRLRAPLHLVTYAALGAEFGIGKKQVQSIIYGKTWKHLPLHPTGPNPVQSNQSAATRC